jgi:O-antigen biosynthesis protein
VISIITPTYNTHQETLARTWGSLRSQTFADWEWVVWDDSTNTETWRQLYGFCSDERYKIAMYRSHVHSGSIGEIKRNASMVAKGDILVELDHDDELTPDCLAEIASAFEDPEVGFVYSDWCEILADGQSGRYPEGWGFGYGSDYWSDEYGVWVMSAPEVNAVTMKHIVSAPNHVRAWRADVYRKLNGHNYRYVVADDYELVVRTFLETKFVHIPKLLYKQHIGPTTAQRQKNALIQELVSEISAQYNDSINARCKELQIDGDENE